MCLGSPIWCHLHWELNPAQEWDGRIFVIEKKNNLAFRSLTLLIRLCFPFLRKHFGEDIEALSRKCLWQEEHLWVTCSQTGAGTFLSAMPALQSSTHPSWTLETDVWLGLLQPWAAAQTWRPIVLRLVYSSTKQRRHCPHLHILKKKTWVRRAPRCAWSSWFGWKMSKKTCVTSWSGRKKPEMEQAPKPR